MCCNVCCIGLVCSNTLKVVLLTPVRISFSRLRLRIYLFFQEAQTVEDDDDDDDDDDKPKKVCCSMLERKV